MGTQSNLDWQYLQNQFANVLVNSYADTNIFTTDHLSKLKNLAGDIDIDRLILRTEPLYVTFRDKYTAWQQSNAFWKAATNKIDILLDDLFKTKIPRWDILVQVDYPENTEEYITLFPNGRTGFRDAGKDGKIQAVYTLLQMLSNYPALSAVYNDVQTFYNLLITARDKQQQREQNVRDSASQLRDAQEQVFIVLYRNLGALMDKYAENNENILNFYSVDMIRNVNKKKEPEEASKMDNLKEEENREM